MINAAGCFGHSAVFCSQTIMAAIGILRKNGETVTTRDFLRIGIPFTLSAVLTGYAYIWLVWDILLDINRRNCG